MTMYIVFTISVFLTTSLSIWNVKIYRMLFCYWKLPCLIVEIFYWSCNNQFSTCCHILKNHHLLGGSVSSLALIQITDFAIYLTLGFVTYKVRVMIGQLHASHNCWSKTLDISPFSQLFKPIFACFPQFGRHNHRHL